MTPQRFGGRAPLIRTFLCLVLFTIFLLHAAGAVQQPVQVEVNSGSRKIKSKVEPEYPELARRARITGTARVAVTVTAEGNVKDVKELGGSPILLASLVRAVKQWKYEPAPKDTEFEVIVKFVPVN